MGVSRRQEDTPLFNQHLTIIEVFFGARRSETWALHCNKSRGLCRQHVNIPSGNSRSSFHRQTLKALVRKILDLGQSRFPGAGRAYERDYRRGGSPRREPKITSARTHPVSCARLFGTVMSSKNSLALPKDTQHGVRELLGGDTLEEVLASATASTAESRQPPCPHCLCEDVTHWGTAHGFPRYRCGSCRRTFNILTKTPLARLRNRERWPTFVGTMIERRSIHRSAAACEVSVTTSSRWRKRFLECSSAQRAKIVGEVIAAFSNASALTAVPEDATWAKELLPVVLSWLV